MTLLVRSDERGLVFLAEQRVATGTLREASSTCTTLPEYRGAILIAVCAALVVAPPISSGVFSPRRSISEATCIISSRLGVMSPDNPMMSAFTSFAFARIFSQGTITPMSMTSKLLQASTMPTMFLPMSCTSPFTVARTMILVPGRPRRASGALHRRRLPVLTSPAAACSAACRIAQVPPVFPALDLLEIRRPPGVIRREK